MTSSSIRRSTGRILSGLVVSITLVVSILSLLVGCSSKEEPLPTINMWQEPPQSPAADISVATSEPDPDGVELLGVTLAEGIDSVMVSFKAPPTLTQQWWQGSVFVTDEATGITYNEIPVMPVIGPLIGKPQEEEQAGYVMLINYNQGIKIGSLVSVVLGNYKREHIIVSE